MQINFERVILTEVYKSEQSGTQFATFHSEQGTFKISSRAGGVDLEKLPRMEPLKAKGVLRGRLFQNGQSLEVIEMSAELANSKKSA